MPEHGDEEKKVAIEFIIECMHCGIQISRRTVYWTEEDVKKLGSRRNVSSDICKDCVAKGKGITK